MGTWTLYGGMKWDGERCTPNRCMKYFVEGEEDREIYLHEEDVITAGLVDFHSHVYAPYGRRTEIGESKHISTGIVSMNDAGTFGYDCWEQANRFWQKSWKLIHIKSFVHLIPDGCLHNGCKNRIDPLAVDSGRLADLYERNKKDIVGFKAHLGWKDEQYDRELLKLGRRVADWTGAPFMVHVAASYLAIEETLSYLMPGDIFAHPFHGWQNALIKENGTFSTAARDAQKAGIRVDLAHGKIHFTWKAFRAAMDAGFMVDTISSDMWGEAWNQAPLYNIDYLFSAMVAFGVPMEEVLFRMTTNPAKIAGHPLPSYEDSLVIFRCLKEKTYYGDLTGDGFTANFRFEPELIVRYHQVLRADI